ncbi:MAG: hypothetical protein N3C60_04065 [Calditerrivibrio sp.]|nr:hypothetical protein [Calditerrivibrio sp.]
MANRNLGVILKEMGLITDTDLEEGLEFQKKEKIRLGEALVRLGKITQSQLDYVISKQIDLPFVIINREQVDLELINRFSYSFMKKHKAIPIFVDDKTITVVTDDPFDNEILEYFNKYSGKHVTLAVGSAENIMEILDTLRDVQFEEAVGILSNLNFQLNTRYDFFVDEQGYLAIYRWAPSGKERIFLDKHIDTFESIRHCLAKDWDLFYEEYHGSNCSFMVMIMVRPEKGLIFTNMKHCGPSYVFYREEKLYGYPYVRFDGTNLVFE